MPTVQLEVNGQPKSLDVPLDMPLLWVLRDLMGLTGTKYGCGVGVCGACVVHVNGRKEQSCQFAVERADGARVTTIEGLSPDGSHPLQLAWQAEDVPQCGYCQTGQIMQAAALLARKPHPTDADIDAVMVDNICRCGSYQRIRAAIHRAAGSGGGLQSGAGAGESLAAAALLGGVVVAGGSGGSGTCAGLGGDGCAGHHAGSDGCKGEVGAVGVETASNGHVERGVEPAAADTGRRLVPTALTRRDILKGGVAFQLAIMFGGLDRLLPRVINVSAGDDRVPIDAPDDAGEPVAMSAWIKIAPDEAVSITVSRSEMGQGVRTSLAMIVAEELDVDWDRVEILQAPAGQVYGNQLTVGSTSTRMMWDTLRQAGATARVMLVSAAAETWGVAADTCQTEPGVVIHTASGRRLTYGELAARAARLPVPPANQVTLKPADAYRVIGQATDRVDNGAVVTGQAIYGMDVRLPGMLHAVVARPTVLGGKVTAFDDTAARKVAGVRHVVQIPTGVAVVADNTWAALQGRDALQLTVDPGANVDLDDAKVSAALEAALSPLPELPAGAARSLSGRYDLPYLAHATMEPMNCVADVTDAACVMWAPTQGPGGVQQDVARALGRQATAVTVNVTLMGGGFGRRSQSDFAVEAAQISNAIHVPVQLTWTRADDMQNDFYRPASAHAMRAALDDAGQILAWQHAAALAVNGGGNTNVQQARPPYNLPAPAITVNAARMGVPTGYWRSVGMSQLTFVNESFFDEVAEAAGQDPFELRRAKLTDARLRAVLERAAAEAGWGQPLPAGEGRGIACVSTVGSHCAVVAQVAVAADGTVKVRHVTVAVDCGIVINPRSVEAQIEGAVVDGLATALMAEITVAGGRVQQSHYNDFKWLRMPDMPVVAVHIVASSANPGGIGELGYPAAPPAVANAIFAATGRRIRRLPIRAADLAGWMGVPTATPEPSPTPGPTQPAEPTRVPSGNKVYLPHLDRS